MKDKLFSGIQPSGDIHLGNYLGALKNWIALLDEYDAIFSIVDYHAITVPYEAHELQQRILDATAIVIAAGLDPERSTLFVQSTVPEHTELCWILGTVTRISDLERMTQFKQKSQQFYQTVNMGLFAYPVLQAADIILYKAKAVPVGEDQAQHIELCREIVRKFNKTYGETFPEPQAILGEAKRILGLDGQAKMSKTMDNTIGLAEDPKSIQKKLNKAVTDPARVRKTDPGNPNICNIFTLQHFFSTPSEIEYVDRECRVAGIGCLECKKILGKNIIAEILPIQEKYENLKYQKKYLQDILAAGSKRCQEIAATTMEEVREKLGMR
ncbi:tryptophan--tRNA ligase [candidate division CSSED10-310 bacterium]|uniref:Tryptophan--tRNA ligase n=1 Tax=candidate division CSSED10-310 bacterium TaxID=2855610 RepID=A0ABV6YV70_UNCC1